jgi:hypothetical protein
MVGEGVGVAAGASTEEVLAVLVELVVLGAIAEEVPVVLVVLIALVVLGGRTEIEGRAVVGAGIVPHAGSEA